MKRLSSLFPLLVMALLAMASFWLEYIVRSETPAGLGRDRHDPDAVVHDFSVTRFDAEGKKRSTLTASRLTHFPDNDTAELLAPRINFVQDQRSTSFVSETGLADNRQRKVTLLGKVVGNSPASAERPEQTLHTDELVVLVDDEIGSTRQPVAYTYGKSSLEGVGAEWNNITGQLKILRNVRAVIPPGAMTSDSHQ